MFKILNGERDWRKATAACKGLVEARLYLQRRGEKKIPWPSKYIAMKQRLVVQLLLLVWAATVSSLATQERHTSLQMRPVRRREALARVEQKYNLRLSGGGNCFGFASQPRYSFSKSLLESKSQSQFKGEQYISHEFFVFFEEQNKADNYAPALVGSWQDWNVSNAIPLFRGAGHLRWSATVALPRYLRESPEGLQYKFILVPNAPKNEADFLWERGINRELPSVLNTSIPSNATEPAYLRHEMNCAPSCVDVLFEAKHVALLLHDGEFLAVVGASRALGKWNPQDAIRLTRCSEDSDTWRASVPVPYPKAFEYKFIILSSSNISHVLWEGGPNRLCKANLEGAVEMIPNTPVLQVMSERSPPAESLMRSLSHEAITPDMEAVRVGHPIGRLESFQRVLIGAKNVLGSVAQSMNPIRKIEK